MAHSSALADNINGTLDPRLTQPQAHYYHHVVSAADPMSYYPQPQPGPAPHEMSAPPPPQSTHTEKRSAPEASGSATGSKRRRTTQSSERAPVDEDEDEGDMAVGGGSRHWTDEEKGILFSWLMGPGQDDHYEAMRTKKNTCFRECSQEGFGGRKSFLAIKGCYERNFVIFKNLHAFEEFTAHMQPPASMDPDSEVDRIREFERKIYYARRNGFNLGSLTSRLLDNWHRNGWYKIFYDRWHDDPILRRPSQAQTQAQPQTTVSPQMLEPTAPQVQLQAPRARAQTMAPPPNPSSSPRYSSTEPSPIPIPIRPMSIMSTMSVRSDGMSRSNSILPGLHDSIHPHDDYNASSETMSPPETPAYTFAVPSPLDSLATTSSPHTHRKPAERHRHSSPDPLSASSTVFIPDISSPGGGGGDALRSLSDCVKQLAAQVRDIADLVRRAEERAINNDVAGRVKAKSETAMEVLANPHVPDEYKVAAGEYLKRFFAMD